MGIQQIPPGNDNATTDRISPAVGPLLTVNSRTPDLQVLDTGGGAGALLARWANSANTPPELQLYKSRGTSVGTFNVVSSGDTLGQITVFGADGTTAALSAAMLFNVPSGYTLGTGIVPAAWTVKLADSTGTLLNVLNTRPPGFTATNAVAFFSNTANSYVQTILQNTNAGAAASTDVIVENDAGTDSANYGDFGINSSGYTGAGVLNDPSGVYLYASDGSLVIGTVAAKAVTLFVNSTAYLTISTAGFVSVGDTGTATASAGAATLNTQRGTITSESLTIAAGARYTLTLTNSRVTTSSIVTASAALGTNTTDTLIVSRITPASGSVVIQVKNDAAVTSWNGTIKISFMVN